MAIGLHRGGPMLEVCVRALKSHRRVPVLCWLLLVVVPTLAWAQSPTVTADWDPRPASENVSSYDVCIGTSSLSCNIGLASVNVSQTSYAFAPPPGQMVYVAVRAINSSGRSGYSTEQRFSIPSLSALANLTSAVNASISPINLSVSDPDGSALTFTHTGLPLGVAMNPTTGQITGTPTSAGTYTVTIFVSDGLASASRSFVWTVTAGAVVDRIPPDLVITSHSSGLVVTSASQTIRGTATDNGRGGSGISAVRVNGQSASGGTASGNNTANWSRTITLTTGSNTVSVEAVDGAGNIQMQQITLQLAASSSSSSGTAPSTGPMAITGITSNVPSPQAVGTPVTFTVAASGGRSPYQFKWWLYDGAQWTMVRDWSSQTTYTWTPSQAGAGYYIGVWGRDASMTGEVSTINRSVPFSVVGSSTSTLPALRLTSLTSNRTSPQVSGTQITFTAAAAGGQSPYQFKWLIFDGASWIVARDWSTPNTFKWTPTQPGAAYRVGVWVRDATLNGQAGNISLSVPFTVSAAESASSVASPLKITSLTSSLSSPQRAGTLVTFTAAATGGIGPYQYKWWILDGSGWTLARDWSSLSTFTWAPPAAGTTYYIGVWVRDSTTTANVSNVNSSIPFSTR